MEARFEKTFAEAVKKHIGIRKQIERKVRQIMEHPVKLGEPLKGNLRGFYSCPVKGNVIIIYLYCAVCRKRGDAEFVACSDCSTLSKMIKILPGFLTGISFLPIK